MARTNFTPVFVFIALMAIILLFVYLMKNPNSKNTLSALFKKLTGGAGPTTPTPTPVQAAPPPQPQSTTPPPGVGSGPKPFTGRSTGPGTRSQDPITQAINDCVGWPPEQYNACVNSRATKALLASRVKVGNIR